MFGWITEKASLVGLVVAVVCAVAIVICFAPGPGLYWKLIGYEGMPQMLDMEFLHIYGPEHADELLTKYAGGRETQYSGFYLLDALFPIAYFFALSSAVALLYRSAEKRMSPWLLAAPLITALCDLGENAFFVTMVFLPGARIMPVAETAAILTQVKFAAFILSALLILAGLVLLIWRRISHHSR